MRCASCADNLAVGFAPMVVGLGLVRGFGASIGIELAIRAACGGFGSHAARGGVHGGGCTRHEVSGCVARERRIVSRGRFAMHAIDADFVIVGWHGAIPSLGPAFVALIDAKLD